MFKLIFKNIIAHRRRYLWIMLELCLATVISWPLLDEVIVNEYNDRAPSGYDIDRLATFNFYQLPAIAMKTTYEKRDIDEQMADVFRILDLIRSDSRVEAATISNLNFRFEGGGVSMNAVSNLGWKKDSIETFIPVLLVDFWRDTDFFKTFGLKDASGAELKDFEEQPMSKNQIIISRSISSFLFPGEKAIGHNMMEKGSHFDPSSDKNLIAGVVNDASYRSMYDRSPIVYKPRNNKDVERAGGVEALSGVIRLKDGVNMQQFIRDFTPKLETDYRFGNICCKSLAPYKDLRDYMRIDIDNANFIAESIALFFFVNILLCMTGTFYLQTRHRSEEAGVMRSFGASRGFIVREMLGEGIIMVTVTWLIGCIIYWLYIRSSSLAAIDFMNNDMSVLKEIDPIWYDDFWTHFTVISLIIYAILLLAVMIGIYFPARKISRINPVDALRAE